MPTADVQQEETESERVARWRAERLERAGFPPDAALELSERIDVDLHRAIGLLDRGCSVETALRILL
jgi:hypothetical protein